MKFQDFREEAAGVGIVTKQNATKDVPVGGEYANVKKLGLGKGKPKEHPKKTKGSKTNVLFNLGMAESEKDIKYSKPNLDHEWDEATRYEEFKKIGKDKWIELVSKGKVVEYNTKTVQKMSNTDAVNVKDFDNLDKNKQDRALKQLEKGSIELPIVASYSDGHLELVGGNTRLTAVMKANGKGKVWQFDVPDKVAKLAEVKTNEVTAKDLAKESEIYVDMDGVLADFFGAWKKLIGTDWREIKDLDGALQKIRDKDDFWLNIPITKNAMNLLGLIKQLKGKYNILSAPLPNDPNSEPHKREWIKKNLSAFPPSKVIITSNKAVHATQPDGTPNILIDDFGQNVAKWEAAGGVGFKHKDHKFERTVKNLKQHMSEAKMSKSSIKSIHKTADKIKDKPKAKKSISNWAKERGMDPEGAIYAIATNMKKRKQGKKIDAPGRESYNRDELPQIGKKHLKYFPHKMETVSVKDIVPVQKERLKENHTTQLLNILEGRFNPIVVDWDNKIVNGHHRYDVVKLLEMESITVAKLPFSLEYLVELTRRGFLKGLGATAAMAALPKAAKAMAGDTEAKWFVINEKGRLQGPMDSNKAKTVSIAYPKKLPDIKPAPEGYEIMIAQGSSKSLNMAFTKASFNLKKLYARRFPGETVKVNNEIINLQGRAIEKAGSLFVATQSAYVKITEKNEGALIPNPKHTILSKSDTPYDFINVGTHMADIKSMDKKKANPDEPDVMIQFYGGEKEKRYMMKNLKRLGYNVQDADGYVDAHYDEQLDQDTYRLIVGLIPENFADGKKKGRKGLSKRVGIPKGASVSQLRKIAKNSTGERRRMAHWQANMKSGRKKKGK